MEVLSHERRFGRGPAPEIIIDRGGDRLGSAHLADALAAFVTKAPSAKDSSQMPFVQPGDRFAQAAIGAALGASLHDAVIFPGRLDDLASFPNIVRDRFFQINIFSRLNGPNSAEGVPVVRVGKGDR